MSTNPNYPDLSKHNNMLSDYLTPEMYDRLSAKVTKHGFTFDQAIQYGVDYPGHKGAKEGKVIGVIAGDEDSYEVYKEIFDPIIEAQHGGYKPDQVHKTDLDPTKIKGGVFDNKYVKSSRVRTARNIRGLPFPPQTTRAERREVERIISSALEKMTGDYAGKYHPLMKLTEAETQKLIDDHFLFHKPGGYISPPSGACRDWPDSRGIWYNAKKDMLVWINEEDQMRFICMQSDGNYKEVFTRFCDGLNKVEALIREGGREFCWNPHLGYISACPSNIGTGIRGGVHLRIEHLGQDERFGAILDLLKLQQRGTGGEKTPVVDFTYDISNAERIGKSEVEMIQLLIDGVSILIDMEKRLEKKEDISGMIEDLKKKKQ